MAKKTKPTEPEGTTAPPEPDHPDLENPPGSMQDEPEAPPIVNDEACDSRVLRAQRELRMARPRTLTKKTKP